MADKFSHQLSSILKNLGPNSKDPVKLRAALQKVMPLYPQQVNLVLLVIDNGMVSDVVALANEMDSRKARAMVEHLVKKSGIKPEHIKWAVQVWVEAFRLNNAVLQQKTDQALDPIQESIKCKNYVEAIQELSTRIERAPTSQAYFLRGVAAYGILKLMPSINHLLRMTKLPPRLVPQLMSSLKNPDFDLATALEIYAYIIQVHSGDHSDIFQNACLYSDSNLSERILALSRLDKKFRRESNSYRIKSLLFMDNIAVQAHHDFSKMHVDSPHMSSAYYYHGESLYLHSRVLSSFVGLVSDKVLQPDLADHRTIYEKFRSSSLRDQAHVCFTEAIRLDSKLYDAYYARAKLAKPSNYDQALADLNYVLGVVPDHAEAHFLKGVIYQSQHNDTQLIHRAFTSAIESNPFLAAAYAQRGALYRDDKQYREAMADLEQAISLDALGILTDSPLLSRAPYYHWLARCCAENSEYDKAIIVISNAISIDPEDDNAFILRAELYSRVNEVELALADYRMASALQDENSSTAFTHLGLGDCYYQLGRKSEALWSYEKFVELQRAEGMEPYRFVPTDTYRRMDEIFTHFEKLGTFRR